MDKQVNREGWSSWRGSEDKCYAVDIFLSTRAGGHTIHTMWSVVTHGHLSETHLAVRLGCVRTSCVRVEFISLSWREDEKNLRERIRKNSRTGRRHRVPSTIERENQIGTVSLTRAKRPERTIVRLLFNHAPVRANRERVAALPRPRSRGLGGGHVPPPGRTNRAPLGERRYASPISCC